MLYILYNELNNSCYNGYSGISAWTKIELLKDHIKINNDKNS